MLLLNNWRARTGFMMLLLVIGGFLFLPIVWMLLTSIKPEGEVFVRIPTILPHAPTLENYRALFRSQRDRDATAQQPDHGGRRRASHCQRCRPTRRIVSPSSAISAASR